MKTIVTLLLALTSTTTLASDLFPRVVLETTEGKVVIELDAKRAPVTVRNFMQYVDAGFYDGTIFHRVIPGFVAQAGGFDAGLREKPTREPIINESGNGFSNRRGTIAMARMADPHSATAQFYINLADNRNLDPNPRRWGYCVFGEVVEGMEVIDRIAAVPTGARAPFSSDVPHRDLVIESARRLEPPEPGSAE